jgi:hypothetical protein
MRLKKLVASPVFCLIAISSYPYFCHAQSSQFEGVSVQAATGLQQQTVKVEGLSIRNSPFKLPDQRYDKTVVPFYLGATYTAGLTANLTLGTVLEYSPISNQVSLSVSPGYAFSEQTQGYLKLGWVYSPTTVDQGVGRSPIPGYMNGGLAGAGVKRFWTKNIYAYAEFNYIKFANLSFDSWYGGLPISGYARTDAFNIMAGLGYRF